MGIFVSVDANCSLKFLVWRRSQRREASSRIRRFLSYILTFLASSSVATLFDRRTCDNQVQSFRGIFKVRIFCGGKWIRLVFAIVLWYRGFSSGFFYCDCDFSGFCAIFSWCEFATLLGYRFFTNSHIPTIIFDSMLHCWRSRRFWWSARKKSHPKQINLDILRVKKKFQ